MRTIYLILSAALGLAGCVDDGRPSTGYSQPSSYSSRPRPEPEESLSKLQQNALETGCRDRYASDRRKYRECVSGNRNFEDVLEDGCRARYRGDRDKLRRCLRGD